MPVTVNWDNRRFHFDLPPPDTTLAAIRLSIAAYTNLPHNAFSLVHDGALMANDDATIAEYHLHSNSTIAVVANTPVPSSFQTTEQAQIASIQAILSSLNDSLYPALTQFLSQLSPHTPFETERARLSELISQALLRLDAIIPEHNWRDARRDRKLAVDHLLSLLEQIDSARPVA